MGRIEKALAKARQIRDTGGERSVAVRDRPAREPRHAPPPVHRQAARHPSELELLFSKAAVLSVDPDTLARHRIMTNSQENPARPSYKMLRTRLLQRMRTNGWTSLAVTAAGPGEGKTITAINLAISLAGEVNQRVFLVDLDLRRPNISGYLGIEPQFSLSDYLRGNATLDQILVNPGVDRLVVIPNETVFENSSEMLSSPKMTQLVDQLRVDDPSWMVIYDMPPLLVADDVLAFSPYVDALLLVVAEGETKQEEVAQARELLKDANVVGTVLNKSIDQSTVYY
ncbi:MAG: CpsD/CapB family tyrosine-protein kinase [Gammaproteobacteria bacterium]